MMNTREAETVALYVLLGLTPVTGILDAVSSLALGRMFSANMTGNVAILAFAAVRVPGLSVERSLTALAAFLAGAAFGGWLISKANEGCSYDLLHDRSRSRLRFSPSSSANLRRMLTNSHRFPVSGP